MTGIVHRTAAKIDSLSRSVWDDSSGTEKLVIAVLLLVTGLAIPVVPVVVLARYIAG